MGKDIAQEIVIQRAKKSWTQQMLASTLNTTQRTVAAWETGKSIPRKAMQVRLAQVFGLPENYFLEIAEGEKEPVQGQSAMKEIDALLSYSIDPSSA